MSTEFSIFLHTFGSCFALNLRLHREIKAGIHMKAVFWLGIMFLIQISRLRFKQSGIYISIPHIHVLGRFVNFLEMFRYIWR